MIILLVSVFSAFGETGDQEEIDFLLFMPNSGNEFANEDRARVQLDNIARYINNKNLSSGQIFVYGYTAFAVSDIDPLALSRERAVFVINQLVRRGIPRDLFSDPVGYGSVFEWGGNTNEEDRIPNRRVRILIEDIIITSEVLIEAGISEEISDIVEETKTEPEPKPKSETRDFEFPWLILLPLLLIPLLLILFRKKNKDKPVKKEKPAAPAPVVTPVAAPAPIVAAPVVAAAVPPEEKYTEHTVNLEEEIRFRAYEHHLTHCEHYSDMEGDWYKALPEVCARYEAKGYSTYQEDGTWWARNLIRK